MTTLKAIGAYVLTFAGFFAFLWWFFDNPREHEILITIMTAFFSSTVAGGIIEDAALDKQEKFVQALITAAVTSGFWVYVFYDQYTELAEVTKANPVLVAVGSVMNSWDFLVMAAITFFTIIAIVKKP